MPADQGSEPVVCCETLNGPYQTEVMAASRRLLLDQPVKVGGMGMGPDPFYYLAAALGAFTSMTLRMYADARRWPLHRIRVAVTQNISAGTGRAAFERTIALEGDLTP